MNKEYYKYYDKTIGTKEKSLFNNKNIDSAIKGLPDFLNLKNEDILILGLIVLVFLGDEKDNIMLLLLAYIFISGLEL